MNLLPFRRQSPPLVTLEELQRMAVWRHFVTAMANAAMLGGVPRHALAIALVLEGRRVTFEFQLSEVTANDLEDIDDIVEDFCLATDVKWDEVSATHVVVAVRNVVPPTPGRWWIYLSNNRVRDSDEPDDSD